MKIRCAKKPNCGMTLAEVVIATGVITIMAIAVIGSINYGLWIMQLARENQRATQIILEKTEAVRLCKWDQVTDPNFVTRDIEEPYDPQAAAGEQGFTYYGYQKVDPFPDSTLAYAPNMCLFTVSLTWTNPGGLVRTRTVSTYVAQHGLQNYVY